MLKNYWKQALIMYTWIHKTIINLQFKISVQLQVSKCTSLLHHFGTVTRQQQNCYVESKVTSSKFITALFVSITDLNSFYVEKEGLLRIPGVDAPVKHELYIYKCTKWEQRVEQEHSILCIPMNNATSAVRLHCNGTAKLRP